MKKSPAHVALLLAVSTFFGWLAFPGRVWETRLQAQPPREVAQKPLDGDAPPDWREQHAYTLGVQAYLYGFPWVYMPKAIWDRTEAKHTPPNQFTHFRELKDASHQMGGAPNNDTLYSQTWVSLKDEPIILSVPEIRDR